MPIILKFCSMISPVSTAFVSRKLSDLYAFFKWPVHLTFLLSKWLAVWKNKNSNSIKNKTQHKSKTNKNKNLNFNDSNFLAKINKLLNTVLILSHFFPLLSSSCNKCCWIYSLAHVVGTSIAHMFAERKMFSNFR